MFLLCCATLSGLVSITITLGQQFPLSSHKTFLTLNLTSYPFSSAFSLQLSVIFVPLLSKLGTPNSATYGNRHEKKKENIYKTLHVKTNSLMYTISTGFSNSSSCNFSKRKTFFSQYSLTKSFISIFKSYQVSNFHNILNKRK